jgi:glycosyltransferase involved in cell wall biosynthesis
MSLLTLDIDTRVHAARGDTVVVVPVYGAHGLFAQCLRALLAHTPVEVPILVMDDASPDDRSRALMAELSESGVVRHELFYARSEENRGFVRTVNDAFARCAPADVIVLNSDCIVTAGWFESMAGAAKDSLAATVSVFTNHGTILSLPYRNQPQPTLPQTLDPDQCAEAIADRSARIRPRLPTAIGHCFLVKRAALDLVGPFDLAFSPGYGEEVDFSQRCVQHGLVHVLADDVFVVHKGSASFGRSNPVKEEHDRMIDVRYGYYHDWIERCAASTTEPLARAIGTAQRSLRGLSVTVDARCLTPIVTGTQIHTLEVIASLYRHAGLPVRVVVPPDLGAYAAAVLGGLASIEVVPAGSVAGLPRTDVVHRPMQVSSHADLEFLEHLGDRIVVTHQDLISYHNPAYFSGYADWEQYRRLTRQALAYADRVVFFSHSAAREAIAEELISAQLADVVYIGTDHTIDSLPAIVKAPPAIKRLKGEPFLLCLGTDYMHKNRLFALRVLDALRREHAWQGGLVFAGPHVPVGSSAQEEAEYRARHPELEDHVVDVAAVDEGAKRWLLSHAAAMIYPSVHEGFGLVPFEAAEAGLLCAFASNTSIAELLPSRLALIEQWDADATAVSLAPLLDSPPQRAEHVRAVRASGARYTWRSTAHRLVEVYEAAAAAPVAGQRRLIADLHLMQREMDALQARHRELASYYEELRGQYGKDEQGLVGPNGVIPPDLHRPLLALGRRRAFSTPAWGLLRTLYRAGYRARHFGRSP